MTAGKTALIFYMKLTAIDRNPDFSESQSIADKLLAQADMLRNMAQATGDAKAALSFSGDRLKRALALAIHDVQQGHPPLHKGSFSADEAKARSSTTYRDSLDALYRDEQLAERQVAQWTAEQAKFEALRSLVSLSKAQANIL